MPPPISPEVAEQVTQMVNRMIAGLNLLEAEYRSHAAIAAMMHLAEQVFTYSDSPEIGFLLMTQMLNETYKEALSSQGKPVN
jgi:hypothetical protein